MKYVPETGFNILVLGRWNPSVFSPQWIRANVSDSDVSLAISIGDFDAPPRLAFSNVQLFPARHSLDARLSEIKEADFPSLGETVSGIVKLLPHTPITAVGINFRFIDEDNSGDLALDFQFADAGRIPHERYSLLASTIARRFQLPGGDALNLSLVHDAGKLTTEFNFHTDSSDVTAILDKLGAANISARLEEAKSFMRDTYNLTLDE